MTQGRLRNYLAVGWMMLFVALSVMAWSSHPVLDSSIMTMLPKDRQQPLVQQAQDQLAQHYAERVVLVLQGNDAEAVRLETARFASRLKQLPVVASTLWRVDPERLAQQREFHFPYRFQVLDPQTRRQLLDGHYEVLRQRALFQLVSPVGGAGAALVEDPFALAQSFLHRPQSGSPVQADHGLLKVPAALPSYLLVVSLTGSAFDTALQDQIMPVLRSLKAEAQDRDIQVVMSGMLLHAAAGAEQARAEISTIGVVSLLGILTMTLLVFRSVNALWLILLPPAAGCLAAAAVTALVFGRIHLVTLAFGAGLVGVSVDYALHYLAEQRASKDGGVLSRILPGLTLGLASSVLAYGAQALAPFPGLQQMACFSAVGLLASWLTVVLWYPQLTSSYDGVPVPALTSVTAMLARWPVLSDRQAKGLLIFLTGLALLLLWQGSMRDDIRLLQTSPQALIDQEREVQQLLQHSSMSRFLLITGADTERVLQREEAVVDQLQRLQASAAALHYSAISSEVPSRTRQRQNSDAVRQLYQHEAGNLYHIVRHDELLTPAGQALEDSRQHQLTLTEWLAATVSDEMRMQWLSVPGAGAASIIRLSGVSTSVVPELEAIAAEDDTVIYVDTVQNLSALLGHYRSEIMRWVSLAYLLVACGLVWRYRQASWRVLGPPFVAGLLAIGVLSHLGAGLNLFHLLALLLVMGIGLDTGIFLMEGSGSRHTWLAVTLAMLTSLLAFGLLVLSRTPVLHYFGLTVLIGLSLVLILSLSIRKTVIQKESVIEVKTPGTA